VRVAGVEDRPRIAVVGAGIGGLALAAALAASGTRCEVFEQEQRAAGDGAGVELAPNAVRPLRRLGLGPVLRAHAVRAEAIEIRGWDGGAVARVPLGSACERLFGTSYYTVRRADLHAALRARVPDDALRFGKRLVRLEEGGAGEGVTLHFADGGTHRADVVVGADGVHSTVRASLCPDPPLQGGLTVHRGLLPMQRLPRALARDAMVLSRLGPGAHLRCYAVAGGSQVSFTATVCSPLGPDDRDEPEDLVRTFGHWKGVPSQIASAAAQAPGAVESRRVHDRVPLKQWSTDRVTVLGDAGHPGLTFTSQGADLCVEDAFDLAGCLADARHEDLAAALARYASLREPRIAAAEQSLWHDDELCLPDGPGQRERDLAMRRRTTLQGLAPLYDYDAGPVQGYAGAG
jgi:salicylate hydroxylase